MNEVEIVEKIRCLKLAVGNLQERVSSLEKPIEEPAMPETVCVKALASATGSEALKQLKDDRALMKRIVKICERSGHLELIEQAKLEGAKIYAQIYYLEKTKPQNSEIRRVADNPAPPKL